MTRDVMDSVFCSIKETADYLHVSERTVHRFIDDGKLEVVRVGDRMIRVKTRSIAQFLVEISPRRRRGQDVEQAAPVTYLTDYQEPPPKPVDWRAEAAEVMRSNPDEWFLVRQCDRDTQSRAQAHKIRAGLGGAWQPAGAFQAKARGTEVWARFIPKAEPNHTAPTDRRAVALEEFLVEVLPVLEYVSRGRSFVGTPGYPYPDATARRLNARARDLMEKEDVS